MNKILVSEWKLLTLLSLGAFVTRFAGLWAWNLELDEVFTIRDALAGGYWAGFKPAYYALADAMFVVGGVSEFTARFPAALFGALAIPVAYLLALRFLSKPAAISTALLILFHPWHLDLSQYARYYSLVFLMALAAFWLFHAGLKEVSANRFLTGSACGFLGISLHATFVFVPLAQYLQGLLQWIRNIYDGDSKTQTFAKRYVIAVTILGLTLLVPFVYIILSIWLDRSSSIGGWGYGGVGQILAFVNDCNPVILTAAIAGFAILWNRDRALASFMAIHVASSMLFLLVGSSFMDMRSDYILPTLPWVLLSAGVYCGYAIEGSRSKWLAPALPALLIVSMLPGFASHYTGRMTLDIKDAVAYIKQNADEEDQVYTVYPEVKYYLKEADFRNFAPWEGGIHSGDWDDRLRGMRAEGGQVWFVLVRHRNQPYPEFMKWLYANARLQYTDEAKRFDYSVKQIEVYRTE